MPGRVAIKIAPVVSWNLNSAVGVYSFSLQQICTANNVELSVDELSVRKFPGSSQVSSTKRNIVGVVDIVNAKAETSPFTKLQTEALRM